MEIIKKNYQQFISYGLIVGGFLVLIAIFIIKPSRVALEETHAYDQKPKLTEIKFPFSQTIKVPENNLSFLEMRFGNDSIDQYQYTITATYESKLFFTHVYKNEYSNSVRIPIDYSIIEPTQGNTIIVTIDCKDACKNVRFDLYDFDNTQTLKTLYGFQKFDYGLFWYGLFPITIGMTLLPLVERKRKHE